MSIVSLKNQKQFDLVSSLGNKGFSPYFMLVVAKDFNAIETSVKNPVFFGMKTSRKLSKKACIRNKIRRRIRHLLRIISNDIDLNLSKVALIFIPYKNFEMVEFAKLSYSFKYTLQKAVNYKRRKILKSKF